MELPPAVEPDLDSLRRRHGLRGPIEPLANPGIFNSVHSVGDDLVLRVPRDDPFFVQTALKELAAVPAARAAGVRTPEIKIADMSREPDAHWPATMLIDVLRFFGEGRPG